MRSRPAAHSNTDPGTSASRLRTAAGTEICPWAAILLWESFMALHYHGNEIDARVFQQGFPVSKSTLANFASWRLCARKLFTRKPKLKLN